jgi:hypothetical protein
VRAIHEGTAVMAKRAESKQQRTVQRRARRHLGVPGAKIIFNAVAKKQLVAKHLLSTVKNRLPRNKTLPWRRNFARSGEGLCVGVGSHLSCIGDRTVELKEILAKPARNLS